jgi:hypothetical protein
MKSWLILVALAATLANSGNAVAQTASDDNQNGRTCQTHVNTDKGDGGMQVTSCSDGEGGIGFGGPIKDVDLDHPVGKGKAFLPQAGRDVQKVVQDGGKTIEKAGHDGGRAAEKAAQWVGKRLGF